MPRRKKSTRPVAARAGMRLKPAPAPAAAEEGSAAPTALASEEVLFVDSEQILGDAPARASAAKPRKVGPYRVLRPLGRGGMAVVYRGVHEILKREVAIKELLAHSRDQESFSRFHREALALAGFRHQNIVTLFDLIEKNGTPYMVLELVDGPTLSALLKEGPLPSEVAAVIAEQLTSALEHAHLAHITHRDIKPSNVMLTREGGVKLMDFGIAKDDELAALTRKGLAIGTPAYMSPEQVTAAPTDHRTDIYSLGVMLYECLSGRRAFDAKNAQDMFMNIRAGKFVSLRRRNPRVPWKLAGIVRRAMKVSPDGRYQDAAQMRRALELYLSQNVRVSHSALLISFLFERGKITQEEVNARLTERELKALNAQKTRGERRLQQWTVGSLFAGTGVLWATHEFWWPWLVGLFH